VREALDNTILRVVTGSQLYGTSIGDNSDRDEVGVCIEPPEFVFGLNSFEQFVYRDAAVRAQAEGRSGKEARSQPGDLDLTIYSCRKFLRYVVNGNPSMILLLYAPEEAQVVGTLFGDELQALAPYIASKRAGAKFLGYMIDQKERLEGKRGQKDVNRPELVAQYGFDTKYAGHLVRLGLQGIELLQTGQITLPMRVSERELVVAVRTGRYTLPQVLDIAAAIEDELRAWLDRSPLPSLPDEKAISRFLVDVYPRFWQACGANS
jgi:hypothetical protein